MGFCSCRTEYQIGSVLVCLGCCNKIAQAGWLKQQKFLLSQFRRLVVQGQGARVLVSGEASFPSLETVVLTVPSHGLFIVHEERAQEGKQVSKRELLQGHWPYWIRAPHPYDIM